MNCVYFLELKTKNELQKLEEKMKRKIVMTIPPVNLVLIKGVIYASTRT